MSRRHPLITIESLVLIAMGGALGANIRYFIGTVVPGLGGTFIANILGCYLLGFILYEARYTGLLAERSLLIFGTGFLSSLTTYSTFALETVQASLLLGVINIAANYTIGFAAVLLGRATASPITDDSVTRTGPSE
jgi:CrcB protein